jgi:HEAT repeat protein/predicted amidohydrolase
MVDQAEIHRKVASGDVRERREGVEQLCSNFADLPDKDEAWEDLIRLTQSLTQSDRRWVVRCWHNIKYWLTWHKNRGVRWRAAVALGSAFQHVPDKDAAWKDLIRLTRDEDRYVRWRAAVALGSAFQHVPDKDAAWKDLIRLTRDEDRYVRWYAAVALGSTFQYVPDKDAAWKDLHRLTGDKDLYVRRGVADALGSTFQHVPDKDAAWKDLHRLTGDNYVRASANHSLGRASIFKATVAESQGDFESELNNAIEFFERSSNGEIYSNRSGFCLPFYRSIHSLMFKKAVAEGEVKKYLAKAKSASEGLEYKETLLEAVENLANALSEAQKMTNFDAMKSDLKVYMQYCDRAADLIGDAAGRAPGAAGILRRGIPIIGERIREIQEMTEVVCKQTQSTPLEELGLETAQSARGLTSRDPSERAMARSNIVSFARDWCEYLPTDKKVGACEQLKNLQLKNLTDREATEQDVTLARVFEYVQENIRIPKIQTVHLSETEHEIVRIAVAQISFDITESFPFAVKNKDEVKKKVFSALDISKLNGANIVCLPELCLYEEWISEIKGKYPDMIVIGGSFYKDNKNICPIIMESDTDIPYQPKITPSPFEDEIMGPRMIPGDRIYRYETRFGKFVILICMDFDDLAHFFRETYIDMIFCPSFNSANERFHNEAHSHVERTPSYILIANTGLHGGTSIFGQLNKNYFGGLADGGCKKRGDSTYKLCEVEKGQEEVIIADFNLDHKGAQVPIPSNLDKVIKSVDHIKKIQFSQMD